MAIKSWLTNRKKEIIAPKTLTSCVFNSVDGSSLDELLDVQLTGDLNDLTTDDKTSVVSAINEVDANVDTLSDRLNYKGAYTGNIDELQGREKCGGYWVTAANASGDQPFSGTYYYLEVPVESKGTLQVATRYNTGETKFRFYTNSQWYDWTNNSIGKMHSSTGVLRTPIMFNTVITFTDGVGTINVSEYLEDVGLSNITGACFAMLRGSTTSSTYSVKKCGANNTTKEISVVVSNNEGTLFSGSADVSILLAAY